MSDMDNALKDFLRTSRSMETNIVSVISDSNRDIEMILKELLIYLDATSKNLEKVQGSLVKFVADYAADKQASDLSAQFDSIALTIKQFYQKVADLDNQNTFKLSELIKAVGVNNQKFLKQILIVVNKITQTVDGYGENFSASSNELQEVRDLLKIIVHEVKETKVNVSKNQDNLMTVIENIMDTNVKKSVASENVEVQKIKSDEEKFKTKLGFIGKIVGILLGSGGIIYLLVDVVLKSISGGS